mmetsp:Transcript_4974/g.17892  ORF Transcript_4974/g.17892 Transcript_4974/m.17892 type:complete len:271 (+) Transcript_4974:1316-2128(+)
MSFKPCSLAFSSLIRAASDRNVSSSAFTAMCSAETRLCSALVVSKSTLSLSKKSFRFLSRSTSCWRYFLSSKSPELNAELNILIRSSLLLSVLLDSTNPAAISLASGLGSCAARATAGGTDGCCWGMGYVCTMTGAWGGGGPCAWFCCTAAASRAMSCLSASLSFSSSWTDATRFECSLTPSSPSFGLEDLFSLSLEPSSTAPVALACSASSALACSLASFLDRLLLLCLDRLPLLCLDDLGAPAPPSPSAPCLREDWKRGGGGGGYISG